MNFRRIYSIAVKEYKHIMRDPFTLAVALILPMVFVYLFGFIIDLDYKHMPLKVRDNDQTSVSRRFLQEVTSSGYFDLKGLHGQSQAEAALNANDFAGILIIDKGFGRNIMRGDNTRPGKAQLLIDGSDNARAAIMLNYMTGIAQKQNERYSEENPDASPQAAASSALAGALRSRFLFNPELNSRWFIVPALNTIIIGFLAIVLTALTVAKEWENGSMELLLSTPVRPFEIIFGKLAPYFLLTFFDILIVFVLAILVFKIPFVGSFMLYMLACAVYITGALALGVFISVVTRVQQSAIQFAFAAGLLPSLIFSGFIFPIENMPAFFRYFTVIFPQRWFLLISRNLFLSDAGISSLSFALSAIAIFAVCMILLAVNKFKTDLEP